MAFDADVIVIGGGPAGCSTAIRLANAGHDVCLLERDALDSGADITSGEVLALQTQIECAELGISLEQPWVFDRLKFVRNVYPDLSWTLHAIPEGVGHIHVDRGAFNAALRQRAVDAGARVVADTTASGIDLRSECAMVMTREGQEYSARILIDAGGRNSVAVNALGLKEREPEFQQIGVAIFFDDFEGVPLNTWDRHLYGEHGAMISGSRIKPGLFRYILEADLADKQAGRMKPLAYFEHTAGRFDPWISERLKTQPRTGETWSMAPLGYRVRELVRDRLVLVGDAAGYLSPITGQGMEFAMRTGRLAANAIDCALRSGDLSAASFAEYGDGRAREVTTAVNMVRNQLRLFSDREALLRCAHDDDFRTQMLGPLPVVDRGSLM